MPPTVLVVDDELLIRWALAERLASAGYAVLEAEDGRTALRQFRLAPDAVLLDLRLPDTDGIELLRRFKSSRPTVEVVMMSAFVSPEVEAEALGLGAAAVVQKPFEVDDMVARVDGVLKRS